MTVAAYAESVSCLPGDRLRFHLIGTGHRDGPRSVRVTVYDVPTGAAVCAGTVSGPIWTLTVPPGWHSSLYRAAFSSSGGAEPDGPDADVHFVVRAPVTGAPAAILVSVPFATWQAYNRAGVPGESIYYAEEPARAARVTFDRPGGGPPPERWEHGLMHWLPRAGYRVDYCANIDLHDGADLLSRYRLLVVNGHDEYWSAGMRDTVERFARGGGNLAFFAGNTCWWQIRLERGGRTMVCYRDAVADPVAATDPGQVTVEWSSAPVHRPENTMTGVSFRRGAGIWGPNMSRMREESYRVRFAGHWVFAGTSLADGDTFARGALGYETDAADFVEIGGVPRITGHDGTPESFVILATADLRHWRNCGQGGAATMGVFRLGAGTVFNAATVNWGAALGDPVVDRITRNVLDRLSRPPRPAWDVIGPAAPVTAITACESRLFGATGDGTLLVRDASGQNLPWRPVDRGVPVRALGTPREAAWGMPLGLYAITTGARLCYRDPVTGPAPWRDLAPVPAGARALACVDNGIFVVTEAGDLWHLPVRLLGEPAIPGGPPAAALAAAVPPPVDPLAVAPPAPPPAVPPPAVPPSAVRADGWCRLGGASGVIALTGMNGRLYAMCADDRIRTRLPVLRDEPWRDLCDAGGGRAIAGHAGMLVIVAESLRWRSP